MKNLTIVFFLLITKSSMAQYSILGTVKDAQSKEGLPNCSIFINNTTIGTSGNINGEYFLNNIPYVEVDVVFSYVGYVSVSKKVSFKELNNIRLDIELSPANNLMSEIEVKSKRDKKWEKQLKRFNKDFFGYSNLASDCEILNPWILNFIEDENELFANATEPLKILNKALGYQISFEIKNFSSSKENYKVLGNAQFKELETKSEKIKQKWLENRDWAYKKSSAYFFRSVIENTLEENGFESFVSKAGSSQFRTNDFYDELGKSMVKYTLSEPSTIADNRYYKRLYIPENLEIHNKNIVGQRRVYMNFNHAVSWISVKDSKAIVDEKGMLTNPFDLMVSGDMNTLRFAGLLPLDYQIADNEFDINNTKSLTISKLGDFSKMPENIIIHTNKHLYKKGESIWFKTYFQYPSIIPINEKSGVVYLDLYNSKKEIVNSVIVKAIDGEAWGEISISDSLASGQYGLRAYTLWMQNFGDSAQSFVDLHIIDKNQRLETKQNDSIQESELKWIKLNKETYKTGETIKLKLAAAPFKAYAVSITNENSDFQFQELKQLNYTKSNKLEIKYPKEKEGRSFLAAVPGNSNTNVFYMGKDISTSTVHVSDEKGAFNINNVFELDSIRMNLYANNKKKRAIKNIIVYEYQKSPIIHDFKEEERKNTTFFSTENNSYDFDLDKFILLDAVEIKAKKLDNPLLERERKFLGIPNKSFSTEDLIKSSGPNVLMSLTSLVPTLRLYYDVEFHSLKISWTRPGLIKPLIPTIWLDGSPVYDVNYLSSLSADAISKIDIYRGPVTVANAQTMISIYTKTYLNEAIVEKQPDNGSLNKFSFLGFQKTKLFYFPDPIKDAGMLAQFENRSTIFWNPNIYTDKDGNAEIEFPLIAKAGRYRIEMVGYDAEFKIQKVNQSFTILE